MKKKIYINPIVYVIFILAIYGAIEFTKRAIITKSYINLSQQIATYIMTAVMIFGVFYIGKRIIKPIPISYDKNEVIIKRYFKDDIVLNYKDIVKAEYYNRYMTLYIYAKDKKYKFSFIVKTKELLEILDKKVKDNNF